MTIREDLEKREKEYLSPYASYSMDSKGRKRQLNKKPLRDVLYKNFNAKMTIGSITLILVHHGSSNTLLPREIVHLKKEKLLDISRVINPEKTRTKTESEIETNFMFELYVIDLNPV